MTKEEVLNTIIEHYKNGSASALNDYCDRVKCADCPFITEDCSDDVAMAILDRLIKAEEHQETNFDHYIARSGVRITKEHDIEVWEFRFKKGTEKQFFDDVNCASICDWLLAPYKEPKPKFKLTKFEYDLLDCCHENAHGIKDFWSLMKMKGKGYFKDLPLDIPTKNILDNCEVVEE